MSFYFKYHLNADEFFFGSVSQNTEDYLFQVILEKTIRIPRSLSVKAASVLKGFLNKNPADRLGCHRESAFMDIVNHPFFKSIDWEMVSNLVANLWLWFSYGFKMRV